MLRPWKHRPLTIVSGVPAVRLSDDVDPSKWLRIAACTRGETSWPLVLVGPAGTGKTCAALCILDWLRSRRYMTVATMCEELIDAQNGLLDRGGYPCGIRQWWRSYTEYECVVVDELGSRSKVSDFQYESVKRAVDERSGKPAIFISNLSLAELEQVYDDRVASRLAGGTVIRFDGPDRRIDNA